MKTLPLNPFARLPPSALPLLARPFVDLSLHFPCQVKTPLLYVPNGRHGFLLALEHGVGDAAKTQRRRLTTDLGFEESDGVPGVAMIPQATDKDILLLVDTSGSMQGSRIKGATQNALKIYNEFVQTVLKNRACFV